MQPLSSSPQWWPWSHPPHSHSQKPGLRTTHLRTTHESITLRMLPTRIQSRYLWIMDNGPRLGCTLPILSKRAIQAIEAATFLLPFEKVNLVLILLHKKYLTELSASQFTRKAELLRLLGLSFGRRSMRGKRNTIRWIQVAVNQAIMAYTRRYSNSLSPLETGILYGYPSSAVLAYMGLVTPLGNKPPRMFSTPLIHKMVHSKAWRDELLYDQRLFTEVRKVSKKIATEYGTSVKAS